MIEYAAFGQGCYFLNLTMSDLSEKHASETTELNVKGVSKPKDVPVFNCIVYVSNHTGSGVHARVANLSDLVCSASTEREALSRIVSAFKQRIVELTQSGTPIPWIEPPSPTESHERKRLIAVHL